MPQGPIPVPAGSTAAAKQALVPARQAARAAQRQQATVAAQAELAVSPPLTAEERVALRALLKK